VVLPGCLVRTRNTYWHLEPLQRKPTEYEIVTTGLLYHPSKGFEVESPIAEWYRKYQKGSSFVLADPDRFRDPRETTYTKYASIQKDKEIYVDGLLESIDRAGSDKGLAPTCLRTLSRVLSPLRFPVHGLQMVSAYVGQMAPGSRIAIAALFQAADEMRRIQRLAYRVRQLEETHSGFGRDGKALWQEDPLWQPMRECIEKLLIAYDWGEAFVALNLVLKPMFDDLFLVHVGALAERSGDPVLGRIFLSLHEDSRWHRDWSAALVRMALADRAENNSLIRGWIRRWHPPVLRAMAAFGPLFGETTAGAVGPEFAAVMERLHGASAAHWESAGILQPLE